MDERDSVPAATIPRDKAIVVRTPKPADAKEISRLVRESGTLDINSDYAYLLVCHHFNQTSVVAEFDGHLVGFVVAYCPPHVSATVFVWQVAVSSDVRGQRLGSRMLDDLIQRGQESGNRFLEATVTPSNVASRALFESLARRHDVNCKVSPLFPAEMFSDEGDHEAEDLFRIGPFF
mgnify:CR=1 FL=1